MCISIYLCLHVCNGYIYIHIYVCIYIFKMESLDLDNVIFSLPVKYYFNLENAVVFFLC